MSHFVFVQNAELFAQKKDSCKMEFGASAEFVSRYMWRGMALSDKPNIQPSLFMTYKNLEAGFWGSFAFDGSYDEVDFYASYSFYNFSVVFNDYYTAKPVPEWIDNRYFYFNDKNNLACDSSASFFNEKNTGHCFEGMLMYEGKEKFPVKIQAGICFFGNDKICTDTILHSITPSNPHSLMFDNNYSVYAEISYPFEKNKFILEPFLGFTPREGMYGVEAGVVNAGIKFEKKVTLCNNLEIPLKAGISVNPQTQQVFLFAGFKL
jgi:hypothetical protein